MEIKQAQIIVVGTCDEGYQVVLEVDGPEPERIAISIGNATVLKDMLHKMVVQYEERREAQRVV